MLPAMVDRLSGGSRDTFGKAERHPWISFGWRLGDRERSFMQACFPDAVPLLRRVESILRGRSWLVLPPVNSSARTRGRHLEEAFDLHQFAPNVHVPIHGRHEVINLSL